MRWSTALRACSMISSKLYNDHELISTLLLLPIVRRTASGPLVIRWLLSKTLGHVHCQLRGRRKGRVPSLRPTHGTKELSIYKPP